MTDTPESGKKDRQVDHEKTRKKKRPQKEDPTVTVARITKRSEIIRGMFTLMCTYSWAVYQSGKQIGKPVEASGKFSYTFGAKGEYFVTAYVCRGGICNTGGITVVIK